MNTLTRASAALLACAVLAAPAFGQVGDTEGIKQTDRFVKAGDATLASVFEARRQIEETLVAYATLLKNPGNTLRNDYRKLLKATDEANKKLADVAPRLDAMNKESEAYFALRTATVDKVADPGLRARGKDRIVASQQDYGAVIAGLQDAGAALAPFMKDLTDHIQFLGADLQPSTIRDLQPDAAKLRERADLVFAKTDGAIKAAQDYFGAMRTQ